MMDNSMFVFGGTGFIGYEVVTQAVLTGWHVNTRHTNKMFRTPY
jgi:hypothetical protein